MQKFAMSKSEKKEVVRSKALEHIRSTRIVRKGGPSILGTRGGGGEGTGDQEGHYGCWERRRAEGQRRKVGSPFGGKGGNEYVREGIRIGKGSFESSPSRDAKWVQEREGLVATGRKKRGIGLHRFAGRVGDRE